jgi:transposase
MSDLFLFSAAQMRRIEDYFPLSHGIARVDDRRIVSAIVFVIKNGLRWRARHGQAHTQRQGHAGQERIRRLQATA